MSVTLELDDRHAEALVAVLWKLSVVHVGDEEHVRYAVPDLDAHALICDVNHDLDVQMGGLRSFGPDASERRAS